MHTSPSLTLPPAAEIDAADRVRRDLSRRVRAAIRGVNGHRTVLRVSVPVPEPVDTAGFLRQTFTEAALYWSGRDSDRSVAAVGAAETLASDEPAVDPAALDRRIAEKTAALPDAARYYGGMRFDATQSPSGKAAHSGDGADALRPDAGWMPFGTYRLVLPRFELVESGSGTDLVCNLVGPSDVRAIDEVLSALEHLALPADTGVTPELPAPTGRRDVPGRAEWMAVISDTLQSIQRGTMEKVVMARRATLDHGVDIDPYAILQHLAPATPNCFHFSFQFQDGLAFIGASPERLLRRSRQRVFSEAVAGTRSRGASSRADRKLRDELLASDKDRREHAHVEDAIRETLAPFCTEIAMPNTRAEMKLTGGRHIWTRIEGRLRPDVSTPTLLTALHPTPAVGGVPTEAALHSIREREGFDRGWYAGPVGWVGREDAEFAVAIRSGRVHGAALDLYSGAGIVRGSQPEEEWDEIEQKIGNFLSLVD